MALWRSGYALDCKSSYPGSIPGGASTFFGKLMFEEAIRDIKSSSQDSSVYIGTDSFRFRCPRTGSWKARYATVVVLHRDSSRGCRVYDNKIILPDTRDSGLDEDKGSRIARLLKEVELTIACALDIVPHCGERHVEIHLDVNPDPKHGSYIALNSAVGWVLGSLNIEPKVKNEAWAATHAADHLCRR